MNENQELVQLAREVDSRCRLDGKFVLRSGKVIDEYFDKYLFEADPVLLGRVASAMADMVPSDTERLGGLELGGIPLVTRISQITGLPAVFVRKAPKPYGTGRLAEGGDIQGSKITLIEDVITTGGAVLNALRALRVGGASVGTVICAIDRSEAADNLLSGEEVDVRSLMTKAFLDRLRARQ